MFFFCKPKPLNVYFYTTREEVFLHAKPEKAAKCLPDWFKNLPKQQGFLDDHNSLFAKRTIKTCPGFVDLYKSGFIFKMWSDLNIEIDTQGGYKYKFLDSQSSIQHHYTYQMSGYDLLNTHSQIKIVNPWHVKTDKDINLFCTAPLWNNFGYGDIVVAQGVINLCRTVLPLHLNLFFKRHEQPFVYELFFGQPVSHIIPLTDRPIKLHYELVTEEELERLQNQSPFKLMGKNRYRRTEKLCPHA